MKGRESTWKVVDVGREYERCMGVREEGERRYVEGGRCREGVWDI